MSDDALVKLLSIVAAGGTVGQGVVDWWLHRRSVAHGEAIKGIERDLLAAQKDMASLRDDHLKIETDLTASMLRFSEQMAQLVKGMADLQTQVAVIVALEQERANRRRSGDKEG
jgi:hypothetical protein